MNFQTSLFFFGLVFEAGHSQSGLIVSPASGTGADDDGRDVALGLTTQTANRYGLKTR
jgi:hypothetical protein